MRLHLLVPVALVVGCAGDRLAAFDRDRTILGPIPLKDQIAWVDTAFDRVVTLDLSNDTPRVHTFAIGRNPVYAAPTPDRDHLLVVTRGAEALARGQRDEDPALWDVDLAHPGVATIPYQVGSPFDRIAVSSDGKHAVAYFSAAGPDDAGFFRNPNEMAFVDLQAVPTETNPVLKTLRAFGSTPTGVVLSPPMSVAGSDDPSPRTFALVFSHNVVTVIDTSHADRNEVSLRLDGAGSSVDPREAVFAPASATAFLRSDGARDVLQIVIANDPPAPDHQKHPPRRPPHRSTDQRAVDDRQRTSGRPTASKEPGDAAEHNGGDLAPEPGRLEVVKNLELRTLAIDLRDDVAPLGLRRLENRPQHGRSLTNLDDGRRSLRRTPDRMTARISLVRHKQRNFLI